MTAFFNRAPMDAELARDDEILLAAKKNFLRQYIEQRGSKSVDPKLLKDFVRRINDFYDKLFRGEEITSGEIALLELEGVVERQQLIKALPEKFRYFLPDKTAVAQARESIKTTSAKNDNRATPRPVWDATMAEQEQDQKNARVRAADAKKTDAELEKLDKLLLPLLAALKKAARAGEVRNDDDKIQNLAFTLADFEAKNGKLDESAQARLFWHDAIKGDELGIEKNWDAIRQKAEKHNANKEKMEATTEVKGILSTFKSKIREFGINIRNSISGFFSRSQTVSKTETAAAVAKLEQESIAVETQAVAALDELALTAAAIETPQDNRAETAAIKELYQQAQAEIEAQHREQAARLARYQEAPRAATGPKGQNQSLLNQARQDESDIENDKKAARAWAQKKMAEKNARLAKKQTRGTGATDADENDYREITEEEYQRSGEPEIADVISIGRAAEQTWTLAKLEEELDKLRARPKTKAPKTAESTKKAKADYKKYFSQTNRLLAEFRPHYSQETLQFVESIFTDVISNEIPSPRLSGNLVLLGRRGVTAADAEKIQDFVKDKYLPSAGQSTGATALPKAA